MGLSGQPGYGNQRRSGVPKKISGNEIKGQDIDWIIMDRERSCIEAYFVRKYVDPADVCKHYLLD